jgi:hypothetical protein
MIDIQPDYRYAKVQRYSKKDRRRLGLRDDQNEMISVMYVRTVPRKGKSSIIQTGRVIGIDDRDPDRFLIHCENETYQVTHYGNYPNLDKKGYLP